ncbi:MAG: AbrB/MazE/SpoVT family DNA-binding domain-containing protein [Oscillospiraceae bacterium]|nr:AbrB/MazE/SpoVT family DNA-binding domain-containing protein [Oscillospiraceae bacterium]
MEVAKVTSKGQITIPISIRRKLEINEGDKVLFIYKPEGVMMVNPNTMQGGTAGDVVEAAETEMAAEAVAALKDRQAPKDNIRSTAAAAAVAAVEQNNQEPEPVAEPVIPQEPAAASRPAPPPVQEQPAAAPKQVGGLDLGSLLDDIRSIGSNI